MFATDRANQEYKITDPSELLSEAEEKIQMRKRILKKLLLLEKMVQY